MQSKDMSIAMDLLGIKTQVQALKKSQQDQQNYIGLKENDNKRLRAEVEVVEGEIEIVSRNKVRAIEESFGHLKRRFGPLNLTTLISNKRLLVPPVTDLLGMMVTLAIRGTEKLPLTSALAEIERPSFIDVLESNQKLPISDELFTEIGRVLALPRQDIVSHPIIEAIPPWLEAIYQMENLKRAMTPKFNKLSQLNKQIEINMVAIDFSNKVTTMQHIAEVEQKLKEQRDLLQQFEQVDASQKRSLEDAEITSIRTDNLINYVSGVKKKYEGKLERCEGRLRVCVGDCLLLAASTALLSPLPSSQRLSLRIQLSNLLATLSISTSEVWAKTDLKSHTKEFQRVLKSTNFSRNNDPRFAESLFVYLHAVNLPVIWDPTGRIADHLKTTAADKGAITISCSEPQAAKHLDQALESSIVAVFLEDYRPDIAVGFNRLASFRLAWGEPCRCNKLLNMLSGHFATYQVSIASGKTPTLTRDYWARGSFVRTGVEDLETLTQEMKIAIMAQVVPEKAHSLAKAQNVTRNVRFDLKAQLDALSVAILSVDEKQLQDSDYYAGLLANLKSIDSLSNAVAAAQSEFDQGIQEEAVLGKQASLFTDLYLSMAEVCELFGSVPYTWSTYTTLATAILAKSMRDAVNKLSEEDPSDLPIAPAVLFRSEDFYKHSVLPSAWKVFSSSLPLKCVPLLALVFAVNIEITTGRLNTEKRDLLCRLLRRCEGWREWMRTFDQGAISEDSWEPTLAEIERDITEPAASKCLRKIRKEMQKVAFQKKFVPVILPEVLEKSKYKSVPLFLRILISLYYPDVLTRRLLRQFIYERLNAVFEYTEEPTPMQHFIKSASWSFPILLRSEVGLNIVNLLCAMANYYGVGLEVARSDTDSAQSREADPCQTIEKCAIEGAWVLIATPKFPSFLKKAMQMLETLRSEGRILNTFRLLVDLQGVTEVPDSFLSGKCVRFHLSAENVDEIEEVGDVWQTILQGQLLTSSQLEMSQ